MNFLELAKKRYSVRSYLPTPIDEEKLLGILEAGRIAPTADNMQPQRFLVIKSTEGLQKLSKTANIYGAPLGIIICGDKNTSWVRPFDKHSMYEIDASIATAHMMLAATAQGLGTCWITYFDPVLIKKEFNFPDNMIPVNILVVGYADGSAKSSSRHAKERKALTELVHFEMYPSS